MWRSASTLTLVNEMLVKLESKNLTEAGHGGAQKWSRLGGVHILRERSDSLGAQSHVLCISAVAKDTYPGEHR